MTSKSQNTNETDDAELLARFSSQGDEEAFKTLVSRYQRHLYNFVWRYMEQHDDVADICQQVFIQVFSKAEQFRGDASFKTWLFQIAINRCRDFHRSKQRHPVDLVAPEELHAKTKDMAYEDKYIDGEKRMLNDAIRKLPEKQRQTLYLHMYQECSFSEVATIMNCPQGTAKANYHHAIKALRKILNPQNIESGYDHEL